MNEMVVFQEPRQLTAVDVRAHVNLVQEVMQAVMKKDTHYGTIPGTPKPTLYKPGAEVLAATFRIAVDYQIEDLSTPDCVRYRVKAVGTHQTSGTVMGAGMGECSSNEEKYKWRRAYDEEFAATPEDKKRVKFGKYTTKQVRTEPADLANTVLKMACKRAQVAMTLNVTAASDIFTQDIEDLPEELRPGADDAPLRPPVDGPRAKSEPKTAAPQGGGSQPVDTRTEPTVSASQEDKAVGQSPAVPAGAAVPDKPMLPGQLKILRAKMANAGLTDADLIAKFGAIEVLGFGQFAEIQTWTQEGK